MSDLRSGLSFGTAILMLEDGQRVCRAGWNGKGMWLKLIPRDDWTVSVNHGADVAGLVGLPWIGMKTADGCFVPWLASQTDILAKDWMLLEG